MKKIRPIVKIHGGKYYLCDWLLQHFPENYKDMLYVEPFCGAASVLMNKNPSVEEAINDLNPDIVKTLKVLRDHNDEFIKKLKKINYTKLTFEQAIEKKEFESVIDQAVNYFILCRMSRGGLQKAFAWSKRTRGGKPGDENAWDTILDQLPVISDRLQNVYILNKPGVEVIKAFNDKNTLLYVDPPYLHETRTDKDSYAFEMTTNQHIQLSDVLKAFKGKVIISGYPSELYNKLYKGWKVVKKKIANHASQQKKKEYKTEVAWLNYQ